MKPPIPADQIEHLVMLAGCAPSVHNTQPWTFASVNDGLVVSRDRKRLLDVIDPDGREQLISCGAALHHLRVAARAMGIDAEAVVGVQGDVVARLALRRGPPASAAEISAAVAILHRHTYRGRFTDEPVTEKDLELMRHAAECQGGHLRIVRDGELVGVEVAVSRAERALRSLAGYAEELERWVWHGVPTPNRGDGLPQSALDHAQDRGESIGGREFDGLRPHPAEPPRAERPTLVLLSSEGDSPSDWVTAGQALSALLLQATDVGLLAQPIGQVLDLPAARFALRQLLGVLGAPQMLLRLGHGTSVASTPRRPVSEVLVS